MKTQNPSPSTQLSLMKLLNFFHSIETSFITEVLEKFSHFTQRIVGLDCFFWAKAVVILYIFPFFKTFENYDSYFLPTQFSYIVMLVFSYISAIGSENNVLKNKTFHTAYKNEKLESFKNARLTTLAILLLLLFLNIFIVVKHEGIRLLFHAFTFMYLEEAFSACTPNQSGKSRLREFFEQFLRSSRKFAT